MSHTRIMERCTVILTYPNNSLLLRYGNYFLAVQIGIFETVVNSQGTRLWPKHWGQHYSDF